jgi:hypothetical protein
MQVQKVTYAIIAYFLLVSTVKDEKKFRLLLNFLIFSGLVVGILGVYEGMTGDTPYILFNYRSIFGSVLPRAVMGVEYVTDRIDGLLGDPNFHGAYESLIFMLSLTMFFVHRSILMRLILSASMLIAVFNMIGSASRGPLLGLAFSLMVFFYFIELRHKLSGLIGVSVLMFILGTTMLVAVPDLDIERFYDPQHSAVETMELRRDNMLMGLQMFLDRPVFGNGPDGFLIEYTRYNVRFPSSRKVNIRPLSVYVQVLSDYGLIGMGIFLTLLIIVFRDGYLLVRQTTGNFRILALGVWSTFIGYSVFMNFTGRLADEYFWIIVALVVSIVLIHREKAQTESGEEINAGS